jgi:hypothetical protein
VRERPVRHGAKVTGADLNAGAAEQVGEEICAARQAIAADLDVRPPDHVARAFALEGSAEGDDLAIAEAMRGL